MTTPFTWINGGAIGARERELEKAKALAHAARESWRQPRSARKPKAVRRQSRKNKATSGALVPSQFSDAFRAAGLEPSTRTREVIHTLASSWFSTGQGEAMPPTFLRYIADPSRDDVSTAEAMLPLLASAQRGVNSPILGSEVLKYKQAIILKLRSSLTAGEKDGKLVASIIALFTAAALEEDLAEMKFHTKGLELLVARSARDGGVFDWDQWALSRDNQSMLDLTVLGGIRHKESDLSGRMSSAWAQLVRPLYQVFEQIIDPELDGPLREGCLDRFANIWLWSRIRSAGLPIDGSLMSLYVTGRITSSIAKGGSHLALLQEKLTSSNLTPEAAAHLHTQAAATYSFFAYPALVSGNSRAAGFLVQSRHHLKCVAAAAQLCDDQESGSRILSSRLIFLAYFIGATWEHGEILVRRGTPDAPAMWFTKEFVNMASRLNVRDWIQVKQIIDRFCPSSIMQPHGSAWVDQALRSRGWGL